MINYFLLPLCLLAVGLFLLIRLRFFFILQGFLALFQCPKILFFLPPDLPHFGSILGLVHTLVHTSKSLLSRMSRGFEFYSGVKINFSITSEVHIFANKEDLLWQKTI